MFAWGWRAAYAASRVARGSVGRVGMARRGEATIAKRPSTSRNRNNAATNETTGTGAGDTVKASLNSTETQTGLHLLDLGPLEEGVLVCRPSARNKSPYVGDVRITKGPNTGRVCVTHLPNLDAGGKCRPGVRLLCRRQPGVTADTVGKFGTPKCELVCQLLRCEEPENESTTDSGGVWVSAHPKLGEQLTQALMERGAFDDRLYAPVGNQVIESPIGAVPSPPTSPVSSQVTRKREASSSVSGSYRPDFSLQHADGSKTIVECKQVVDSDYDPETAAIAAEKQPGHPVYTRGGVQGSSGLKTQETKTEKYIRCGIFPWGKRGQKGPDGEPVVSSRAIDHLRELTVIAESGAGADLENKTRAAVVLIAGRHDVFAIAPNGAACPSFSFYSRTAREAGVSILGHKVRWGESVDEIGKAFDDGPLPIEKPLQAGDEVLVAKEKKVAAKGEAKEGKKTAAKKTKTKAQVSSVKESREESVPAKRQRRNTKAQDV